MGGLLLLAFPLVAQTVFDYSAAEEETLQVADRLQLDLHSDIHTGLNSGFKGGAFGDFGFDAPVSRYPFLKRGDSVEIWGMNPIIEGEKTIFSMTDASHGGDELTMMCGKNMAVKHNHGKDLIYGEGRFPEPGRWHHMALTYDGTEGKYTVNKSSDGVVILYKKPLKDGTRAIRINVLDERIFRVSVSNEEEFSTRESLMLVSDAVKSEIDFSTEEKEDSYFISTDKIKVKIDLLTGKISFGEGATVILSEASRFIKKDSVEGEAVNNIFQSFYWNGEEEQLYGLGSSQQGFLSLRGQRVPLFQQNREMVVQMLLSSKGYGILWDNYSLGEYGDARESYYLWSEVADEIDYYFIAGNDADAVIAGYRKLTGSAPMFPKWAYGFMQSRERYKDQNEIVEALKELRKRKVPVDLMVQDWYTWKDGEWGQKTPDPSRFPDIERMVDEIHGMNAKVMISIWPNVTEGCPDQVEWENEGCVMGNRGFLDPFIKKGRDIYWKQTNDAFFSKGMDGFWIDCTEPFDSDWTSTMLELPAFDIVNRASVGHKRQMNNHLGSGARYLLAYSLMHAKGMYEGWRQTSDDKRVFMLTRSANAGQQRYATVCWTGDISGTWEYFRAQIPAGLNFCASGMPYWTSDIGGFFVKNDPYRWFVAGNFEQGPKDEGYKELYTRWYQFAAFCPIFRAHGTDYNREIWNFGEPGDKCYDTQLKFSKLRYRLLPYIYSNAWRVTNDAYTMMRPLVFDFPDDDEALLCRFNYMFGDAFLVCPVTEPYFYWVNSQKYTPYRETMRIYLPSDGGTKWFDFWTNEVYEGGKYIEQKVEYTTMPIFVRAGSIVPFGPEVQYATEDDNRELEIRIYPGADATFELYEDENDNYNYEKGCYSLIEFVYDDELGEVKIKKREGNFEGMLKNRIFKVRNMESGELKIVKYNGKCESINIK